MIDKPDAIIIEGHVQGLSNVRSLGSKDINTWVLDTSSCIAKHSKYCKKFIQCPPFNSDEFISFLIDLSNKYELSSCLLLPSNDHIVKAISKNSAKLNSLYKLITPSYDIIENIYDKSKLLSIAISSGVACPETFSISSMKDISEIASFPILIKGKEGLSFYKKTSKKAFQINSKDQLIQKLEDLLQLISFDEILLQELIPFDENHHTISVALFCENGIVKTHWMGEKLREHPIRFGTATMAKSIEVNELKVNSMKLAKALNYSGICEIEYLWNPLKKEYQLIEINARTWLWVGLAKACGVDFAKIAYDYVNNNKVNYPDNYLKGVYWVNPITNLFFTSIAFIKGKIKLKSIMILLFKKKNNALFIWSDMKPGFIYLLSLFKIYRNR